MVSLGKAVVLYDDLPDNAAIDELDVLLQVDAVSNALDQMGFDVFKLAFTLQEDMTDILLHINPGIVFNLVESVSSKCEWSYLAPALLEKLGIQYTGCSANSIYLTTNKIATKRILKHFNISTPAWTSITRSDGFIPDDTYIVKALYEDASVGLCSESIMSFHSIDEAKSVLKNKKIKSEKEFFAEKFIDGREFSIPILGECGMPRIIAPYEICFNGYDERDKVKILDYTSKWDIDSFEHKNTFAVSHFHDKDDALIRELRAISEECWSIFKLRGYARIDFRVDKDGKPWVLEINANPCITPSDSGGFLETAKEKGINFNDIVHKIILDTRDYEFPSYKERCTVN